MLGGEGARMAERRETRAGVGVEKRVVMQPVT